MAFWDFLCVCIKLLSQNTFKCLRSVVEGLYNLVGLLEARKNFFLCIILSLLTILEIIQQCPQGTSSGPKARSSLASLLLPFQAIRALNKLYRQRLTNFWDFPFLVYFFQLFCKIIAISYKVLKKILCYDPHSQLCLFSV